MLPEIAQNRQIVRKVRPLEDLSRARCLSYPPLRFRLRTVNCFLLLEVVSALSIVCCPKKSKSASSARVEPHHVGRRSRGLELRVTCRTTFSSDGKICRRYPRYCCCCCPRTMECGQRPTFHFPFLLYHSSTTYSYQHCRQVTPPPVDETCVAVE